MNNFCSFWLSPQFLALKLFHQIFFFLKRSCTWHFRNRTGEGWCTSGQLVVIQFTWHCTCELNTFCWSGLTEANTTSYSYHMTFGSAARGSAATTLSICNTNLFCLRKNSYSELIWENLNFRNYGKNLTPDLISIQFLCQTSEFLKFSQFISKCKELCCTELFFCTAANTSRTYCHTFARLVRHGAPTNKPYKYLEKRLIKISKIFKWNEQTWGLYARFWLGRAFTWILL